MRLQSHLASGRLIRFALLAMMASLGAVIQGSAQDPPATIFAAARAAQQLSKSEQLGFSIVKTAFNDIPAQGGVLIGFDVQLSKFLNNEIIHALRPIYATEAGNITTKEFGQFADQVAKKKNNDFTRALRIIAPPGYAVGGITVRRGLYIDGLKLTFQRIKGISLDTRDVRVSDWIGNDKNGATEKKVGGYGAAIVGIHGNMDERRVLAIGIYQLPATLVALPRPGPKLQNDPVVAKPKPDAEKAAPEQNVADEAPEAPAEGVDNDVVADEEPNPVQGQNPSGWLPIFVFACVSGVFFVCCWFVFGGKQGDQPQRQSLAKKTARTKPPPLPKDDAEVDAAPAKKRATPPPLPADFDETPLPDPVVDMTAVIAKAPYPSIPPGALTEKPAAGPEVTASESPRVDTAENAPPADAPLIAKPPYFHARAVFALKPNQFYRVYVLPEMLLFLDSGPESNAQFANGIGAAGAATGGILGAAVGAAIGSVIDGAREDTREARIRLLDKASTDQLIELAGEGGANFRVVPADLRDARVEPTSAWHTMKHLGNQYVGLLCFSAADQGDMTLELPTPNDMRIALEELPPVFGDHLVVNVKLDRRTWQFVSKS